MFIYRNLYSLLIDLYSLLCFVLHTVLTCMRQESSNEWYRNTVKGLLLLNTVSQKDEKLHTIGLDDTVTKHVKISITLNPNVPHGNHQATGVNEHAAPPPPPGWSSQFFFVICSRPPMRIRTITAHYNTDCSDNYLCISQ